MSAIARLRPLRMDGVPARPGRRNRIVTGPHDRSAVSFPAGSGRRGLPDRPRRDAPDRDSRRRPGRAIVSSRRLPRRIPPSTPSRQNGLAGGDARAPRSPSWTCAGSRRRGGPVPPRTRAEDGVPGHVPGQGGAGLHAGHGAGHVCSFHGSAPAGFCRAAIVSARRRPTLFPVRRARPPGIDCCAKQIYAWHAGDTYLGHVSYVTCGTCGKGADVSDCPAQASAWRLPPEGRSGHAPRTGRGPGAEGGRRLGPPSRPRRSIGAGTYGSPGSGKRLAAAVCPLRWRRSAERLRAS